MFKKIFLPCLTCVIFVLLVVAGCSKKTPTSSEQGVAPAIPTLFTPINGDTAIPTYLTLGWNAASGASGYTIQISKDSIFCTLICDKNGLRETSDTISTLDTLTSYYWRVNAVNAFGASGWSDIWEFKTSHVKSVTVEWIVIPAGNFTMGSTASDTVTWPYSSGEYPQHTVYLDVYKISKYEITNAQYKAFMDAGGYSNSAYWTTEGWTWRTNNNITGPSGWSSGVYNSGPGYHNYPVWGVSWYEAYAFCKWLDGHLPTEAQWEKAARGTVVTNYWPWGNIWDASKCKNVDNTDTDTFGVTTPVGYFHSGQSPYGVYDMAGNVWEWCNDWYSNTYYSDLGASTNPSGPITGTLRVERGGDWAERDNSCRSANRGGNDPNFRFGGIGLRPAK